MKITLDFCLQLGLVKDKDMFFFNQIVSIRTTL